MTEQNKDGAKRGCDDAISLKDVQLVFPFSFLFYAYSIVLNDRLCQIYLFFLCCTFPCVNSKMLNEFSILTKLIK